MSVCPIIYDIINLPWNWFKRNKEDLKWVCSHNAGLPAAWTSSNVSLPVWNMSCSIRSKSLVQRHQKNHSTKPKIRHLQTCYYTVFMLNLWKGLSKAEMVSLCCAGGECYNNHLQSVDVLMVVRVMKTLASCRVFICLCLIPGLSPHFIMGGLATNASI